MELEFIKPEAFKDTCDYVYQQLIQKAENTPEGTKLELNSILSEYINNSLKSLINAFKKYSMQYEIDTMKETVYTNLVLNLIGVAINNGIVQELNQSILSKLNYDTLGYRLSKLLLEFNITYINSPAISIKDILHIIPIKYFMLYLSPELIRYHVPENARVSFIEVITRAYKDEVYGVDYNNYNTLVYDYFNGYLDTYDKNNKNNIYNILSKQEVWDNIWLPSIENDTNSYRNITVLKSIIAPDLNLAIQSNNASIIANTIVDWCNDKVNNNLNKEPIEVLKHIIWISGLTENESKISKSVWMTILVSIFKWAPNEKYRTTIGSSYSFDSRLEDLHHIDLDSISNLHKDLDSIISLIKIHNGDWYKSYKAILEAEKDTNTPKSAISDYDLIYDNFLN